MYEHRTPHSAQPCDEYSPPCINNATGHAFSSPFLNPFGLNIHPCTSRSSAPLNQNSSPSARCLFVRSAAVKLVIWATTGASTKDVPSLITKTSIGDAKDDRLKRIRPPGNARIPDATPLLVRATGFRGFPEKIELKHLELP